MNGSGLRSLRGLFLRADAVLVVVAMAAAYLLHALLRDKFGFFREPAGPAGFILLGYLALPLWLFLISVFRLDRILENRWSWPRTGFRLAQHHLLGFGVLSAISFLAQIVVNRSIVVSFLGLSFVFLLGERMVVVAWARRQHARGHARARLLLVGEPGEAMQEFVAGSQQAAFAPEIVGYLGRGEDPAQAVPRLGSLVRLPAVLHAQAVDEVVLVEQLSHRRVGWLLRVCADLGIDVRIALPWQSLPRVRPYLESEGGRQFVRFGQSARRAAQLASKQVFDVLAVIPLVILLFPLLAFVALVILVLDGRPVIFSQVRVGLHGRRFRMWKFRTMVKDAEAIKPHLEALNEVDGPAFKLRHDPRVTRFGEFLRRSSLDELPQLFNVLEGSMSLVGPRPLPESEQQRIHGSQRRRLSMKPGITGLWQVSGRSSVAFADWMRMDQEYVDRWSLWLDMRLLLATVPAVLRRKGAS
ncbi:MAG: sugar transferase [Deltaproteobacteria bacterium]|nr:sugar transferase [Deltaproteobacteria bacterium]